MINHIIVAMEITSVVITVPHPNAFAMFACTTVSYVPIPAAAGSFDEVEFPPVAPPTNSNAIKIARLVLYNLNARHGEREQGIIAICCKRRRRYLDSANRQIPPLTLACTTSSCGFELKSIDSGNVFEANISNL